MRGPLHLHMNFQANENSSLKLIRGTTGTLPDLQIMQSLHSQAPNRSSRRRLHQHRSGMHRACLGHPLGMLAASGAQSCPNHAF